MTTAVDPEKILRDLRDLWVKLGVDQKESGGVLRACAMTLLAVTEDETASAEVRRILADVMHEHPSRAIMLCIHDGAKADAQVFAECWAGPPVSQVGRNAPARTQICTEGIQLTVDASQMESASQLILPLLAPDLPVVLWYRRLFQPQNAPSLEPLLRLAQKVIVDSSSSADPAAAVATVRGLRAGGRRVADLAWTRLTGWREAVANAFGCKKWTPADVMEVRVEYSGKASSSVLYFEQWIQHALPAARVVVNALVESGLDTEAGEPGLRAVTLSSRLSSEVSVNLAGAGAIEVRAGDCSSRSLLPSTSEGALMREELGILGEDVVFGAVLERLP
jgi:glucose-6-phosphate dehydrogenase assembly protein OpcA